MEVIPKRKFKCLDCGAEFEEPYGKPRWMVKCPKCGGENVVRADAPEWGRGYCRRSSGRGAGRGWGRGFGFRFRGGWRG
jgi:DNA-directed RNA polymerase subunit RPC12/RpoP